MKIPAWKSWNHVALTPADAIKNKLFQDLVRAYAAAHGFDPHVRYITGSRLETDLPHMAVFLRQQGWSCYFYRDSATPESSPLGFAEWGEDRMGLMIGEYCSQLLIWRLSN